MVPTQGRDKGQERLRKYVDKCYAPYRHPKSSEPGAILSWSRRPFSVMAQNLSAPNATLGPPECRRLAGRDFSDPRELEDYDKYERCLGMAYWPVDRMIDPETGAPNVSDPLKLAFTWRDDVANQLKGVERPGKFARYDGSGYVYDLTNLTTDSLVEAFEYLQENTWLDRQTRAVFISLVTYNANFNLYAVCNFQLELSLAGVIIPKYSIQTVKMDLFFSFFDL